MSDPEQEIFKQKDRDLVDEISWYRGEMLELVEADEQGSKTWYEYYEQHKEACKRRMELHRRFGHVTE